MLDLYSPRWEVLDEGSYAAGLPWLRPRAGYSAFYGNKLFTLKPSMHEKLWEVQVRAVLESLLFLCFLLIVFRWCYEYVWLQSTSCDCVHRAEFVRGGSVHMCAFVHLHLYATVV